jgi:hypothetical protein
MRFPGARLTNYGEALHGLGISGLLITNLTNVIASLQWPIYPPKIQGRML